MAAATLEIWTEKALDSVWAALGLAGQYFSHSHLQMDSMEGS
jgi:hypothetical protein